MTNAAARLVLFAYGSLKRGQPNHRELSGARFLGLARTTPCFALREIDGYPALVPGERSIHGELYELPAPGLAALDEFEGEGYRRQEIELAGGATAIAYVARAPTAGTPLAVSDWPAPRPAR